MFDNLNKYLAASSDHLGVERERYGGDFRAIAAPRPATEFLFSMLEGSDIEGTEAQGFLWSNPLFPATQGDTPTEALARLDAKLGLLYRFEPGPGGTGWIAVRQFTLLAQYDGEPGEAPESYDVRWGDIIEDLQNSRSTYFYEDCVKACSATRQRDLHALIHFDYTGAFASLRKGNW
ncbi:Uncharacterised protein [Achromobacter xylosoxidans]|uniref:hypothetical protein n=1 Tax=Achromobacter TaxID=222 RepID=UPI0006C6A123|nr:MULTISPECIES: hypothetical protein [Achromobacter]CAB3920223.1 hypothetical protein LMG26846_05541 [Achromobacter insuavis]CUJ32287.1 Uncharacterised protein [Achromobacter xylosoxidans]CUJ40815.1 Uncharacterised protein [Achromobacter sp. 2789STDY5608621]